MASSFEPGTRPVQRGRYFRGSCARIPKGERASSGGEMRDLPCSPKGGVRNSSHSGGAARRGKARSQELGGCRVARLFLRGRAVTRGDRTQAVRLRPTEVATAGATPAGESLQVCEQRQSAAFSA